MARAACNRSDILQVPIALFYEGASDKSAPVGSDKSMRSLALLDDFVSSREGLRLVESFMRRKRRKSDVGLAVGSEEEGANS